MRQSKNQRGLSLVLVVIILFSGLFQPIPAVAKAVTTKNAIKVSNFIKIIVQATGLEIDESKSNPYLNAAITAGIVKTGDFKDYKAYLTRTDAAVILNRADEYLYEDTVDSKLLKTVLEERISDISKIAKDKREAVAMVYAKGFMKGYSNGYYIKNREIRGNEYMTTGGTKGVVAMLKNIEKRYKISPDGQLIRTTNLPKNAKDYEYILEAYPNSFYEMKFKFQRAKYYFEPIELEHYASPARMKDIIFDTIDIEKYKDNWIEKVETNLNSRLNVDYRTVDSKWINTFRSVFTQFSSAHLNKEIDDDIKAYVKSVKNNKIVIQSKVISVEPSTLYMKGGGMYVRVYVKFKLNYTGSNLTAEDLIAGDRIWLPKLKRNTWFDGIYDIELATINGYSNGSDYYISNDSLIDYED